MLLHLTSNRPILRAHHDPTHAPHRPPAESVGNGRRQPDLDIERAQQRIYSAQFGLDLEDGERETDWVPGEYVNRPSITAFRERNFDFDKPTPAAQKFNYRPDQTRMPLVE